jgi:hypothetical protein
MTVTRAIQEDGDAGDADAAEPMSVTVTAEGASLSARDNTEVLSIHIC